MLDLLTSAVKNAFVPGFIISFLGLCIVALLNKKLNQQTLISIVKQSLWYAAYGAVGNIVQALVNKFSPLGKLKNVDPYGLVHTAVKSMLFFGTVIIAKQLVAKKVNLKLGLEETINSFLGCAGEGAILANEGFANKYMAKELAALSEFD